MNKQSWYDLLASARTARPPGGIDVRAAVRQAIESEPAQTGTTMWDELAALAQTIWLRGLLGGGAVAAACLVIFAIQSINQLMDIAHVAAPLFTVL
jgi:hypothetical protein